MKASTEQYFPGILFIMLQKVILTLESVDEPLKCVYSSENYWAVLFCGTVYYAAQGGSNFKVCRWNLKVWPFKWKLLSSTFLRRCLLSCRSWFSLLSLWINPKVRSLSQNDIILEMVKQDDVNFHANLTTAMPPSIWRPKYLLSAKDWSK